MVRRSLAFACALGVSFAALLGAPAAAQAPQPAPARLRVLFLGDDDHHTPSLRAADVHATLAARGIDLFYTPHLADLTAARLAAHDALLIYANHPTIPRQVERDLLAWVEGGGALVAVHCASYCFRNSPRFIELVGAQFERHGGGEFRAEVVAPEHPITRDWPSFTSWDETYVHTKHNAQRTVLAVRREAGQPDEPWTWVREFGKGRVFYTASGHDARTWSNPAFHELLTRALRFCARRDVLAEPPAPPFASMQVDTPVPDYQPGKRTEDQVHQNLMQRPLAPEASLARMVVAPDLRVELFAAEPELRKPIALTFDARGRLFVAETIDYPNNRKDSAGSDRIRVLEDRDGDGRAEHFVTFAEGLSVPTSLCWADDGLVVLQAPDVLLLRDTDGDDRADERRVLFSGWGTGDTHAGPSNLRYAPDNWLWGTVGYSGFNGTVGGEERRFGQAIWRMRPDGSAFEVMGSTSNNTWGLGLSDEFFVFASTANGNPGVHLAIPTRFYEQVPGLSPGVLPTIVDHDRYHPIASVIRQVDFHGRYTAGAGAAIYTARALPHRFWNRAMLVTEPTGNLAGIFELSRKGAGFRARNAWNLLVSDDQWTAPIAAEVGPDGAIWVLDWYNFIVQHNPTPHGFKTGRGNAYETPLRDKVHGRVLRISARDATPTRANPNGARDLSRASAAECLAALRDDNQFWRLTAQRRLVGLGASGVDAAAQAQLLAMVGDASVDALGLNHGALHALWTLHGLGLAARADVREAMLGALRHPAMAVRRAALMTLPADDAARDAIVGRGLLADVDPRVRLDALLALAAMPRSEAVGRAIFTAAQVKENQGDALVADALILAAARHDAGFLAALLAAWRPETGRPEPGAAAKPAAPVNLLVNPSFEETSGDMVANWQVRTYSGRADHALDRSVARTGKHSLRIRSERGADSSFFVDVEVEPQRTYRLSGWVKTERLGKRGGFGALFNVHGRGAEDGATPGLRTGGDHDWAKQTLVFESGGDRRLSINCLFGGWGQSTGTAWFDDLELVAIDGGLSGRFGRIAGKVVHAYAARAPRESAIDTLLALRGAPNELIDAVVGGLSEGWPAQAAPPQLDAAAGAALSALASGFAEDARVKLLALTEKWGQRAALTTDVGALATKLRAEVAERARSDEERLAAARRLVVLDDGDATVAALVGGIDANAAPSFAAAVIDVVGASASPSVAASLLGRWKEFTPTSRTAAVNVLLRRPAWTKALLDAVGAGTVAAFAIPLANWQTLERHPDAAIASLAKQVRGQRAGDRQTVLAKFLPLAEREGGDAERGRGLFAANCAVCHRMGGQGGVLGPELDGIGARPRRDTLLAILDPNASVESNFVMWLVTLADGTVMSGRLDAETRTTVELLDLTGKRHVLVREQIKSLQSLDTSLMPAGFESLGEQGLLDLMAYLGQSHSGR